MEKISRYKIQDYFSGLDIVDKNGYAKYFKSLNDAECFVSLMDEKGLNDEDNFYIVKEDEQGNIRPIEY